MLPTTYCLLPTADQLLPTSHYSLHTAHHLLVLWKVPYIKWHSKHWRLQRAALRGRKLQLFFGQKFAPKLIMFTCLTVCLTVCSNTRLTGPRSATHTVGPPLGQAALRIDPLGDGVRLNFAMFRSFITISACVIYWVIAADKPQPYPTLTQP